VPVILSTFLIRSETSSSNSSSVFNLTPQITTDAKEKMRLEELVSYR
jgi:hypothetical protein